MKKKFLSIIALITLVSTLGTAVPTAVGAQGYDNLVEQPISGFDCKTDSGNVFVYPNKTDKTRVIMANEYGFRYTKLMVFDGNGMLIEAGGDIYENSASVTGAPQVSVSVPAGGFLVAFKSAGKLSTVFDVAMEGAMLYNATMSVIYPVKGSYSDTTLTLEYNNPKPDSANAKKFLFVGNSTTYFNGTPIKFKALANAAGVEVDVDYCTFGSAFLSEFADASHTRGIALRNQLKSKKYDYVVLQDAAGADYYSTKPAVATILPLIQENGAKAVLYKRYSAASTLEQKIINAKKHHSNYTRVAEEFSLGCSPAADAFIYSCEKYPDINLYADDGGHHSKEGSYLIACCWLYSYLGIDPVGNSYDAQMDASTAAKLQECAKLAVENGYPYPEDEKDSYTDSKGNIYQNISAGKKYVPSGNPYNGNWTDTGSDGKPMGKLTDGKFAGIGSDQAVGCYSGTDHSITIDLGELAIVHAIKTDLHGNEGWGIKDPTNFTVKMQMSNDGIKFTDLGDVAVSEEQVSGDWKKRDYVLELDSPINARYIRVTYVGNGFVWSSEVGVYGTLYSNDPEAPESTTEESSPFVENEEPKKPNKSWLYWIIGGAVIAAAAGIAIIISKKKK